MGMFGVHGLSSRTSGMSFVPYCHRLAAATWGLQQEISPIWNPLGSCELVGRKLMETQYCHGSKVRLWFNWDATCPDNFVITCYNGYHEDCAVAIEAKQLRRQRYFHLCIMLNHHFSPSVLETTGALVLRPWLLSDIGRLIMAGLTLESLVLPALQSAIVAV